MRYMNILTQLFKSRKHSKNITLFVIFIGIALRFYFISFASHKYDMATFHSWAINLQKLGPANFYNQIWTDYLPLPLYLTVIAKYISILFKVSFPLAFKSLFTILELILLYILHINIPSRVRKWSTPLLLLSPFALINTTIWGQIDMIPSLLLAISLSLLLYSKRTLSSAIIFALAVAIKPIVLLTLPIYIPILLRQKNFVIFSISSLLIFLIPAIPVVQADIHNLFDLFSKPFIFLFNQSSYQASMYPYTTINAFNYWSLSGANWLPDNISVLGITKQAFGLILFVILAAIVFLKNKKNKSKDLAFNMAGSILVIFYIFTTRMHERHLIYGLPLIALSIHKFRYLLLPYLVFSFTSYINMSSALYWVNNNQVWPIEKGHMILISWINVLMGVFMVASQFKINLHKFKKYILRHKTLSAVFIIALFLRTINLVYPESMIFDEVYHAFTAKSMLVNDQAAWEWWNTSPQGFAYEWTHPPLAKYGMVIGMLVFGANSFGWRIGSALIGAFSILIFYKLTKIWFKNSRVALIAAGLLSIEGIHLVQSRIAMNDVYALFFILLALYLGSSKKWKHSAVAFGFALSSKWSAVYALMPILIIYAKQFTQIDIRTIVNAIRLILISVIVYILLYTPFFLSGHTFAQFQELHWQMWNYHTSLIATHSYESTPSQWVLALRPIWYHVERFRGFISNIYNHANPAIAWLGLIAIVDLIRRKDYKISLALISYLSFLIPWTISPRIMFNYHYLPSITFLVMILAYWINLIPRNYLRPIISIIILTFIILWPMYTGTKAPQEYWDIIFSIFPTWK